MAILQFSSFSVSSVSVIADVGSGFRVEVVTISGNLIALDREGLSGAVLTIFSLSFVVFSVVDVVFLSN